MPAGKAYTQAHVGAGNVEVRSTFKLGSEGLPGAGVQLVVVSDPEAEGKSCSGCLVVAKHIVEADLSAGIAAVALHDGADRRPAQDFVGVRIRIGLAVLYFSNIPYQIGRLIGG